MRGGDTAGLRAYNERLIVSAIRTTGALSKAEIARATGLSGQAASVIVNALVENESLIKLDKVRGQVGQPYTPIALNPTGAYSLGIKIGRRSAEVVLVDFLGDVVASRSADYEAPFPDITLAQVVAFATDLLSDLSPTGRERVVGVGVAIPGELHAWAAELDLPHGALDGWRDLDVAAELSRDLQLPVEIYNDATAACAAEIIVGDAVDTQSALYFFLGTFIGGGVILDGRLHRGEQLNAGALGSMPMTGTTPDGRHRQLIHCASVIDMSRALIANGSDPREVLSPTPSALAEKLFEQWMNEAIPALTRAVVTGLSVIDFETVVIDGVLTPPWRERLTKRLQEALAAYNRSGLSPARVTEGSIGPKARVLGAALLPLNARYSPDTDLLVKPAVTKP